MTGYERRRLTVEEANALFDVVVEVCDAHESLRAQWLHYAASEDPGEYGGLEFRFQGNLGFGGKLNYDGFRPAYVSYYSENRTAARDAAEALANERLVAVSHPYLRRD